MKNILFYLGIIIFFSASCKKGVPIEAPGFGTLQVKSSASTPDVSASFILQVDGITLDTLRSTSNYQKNFKVQNGQRQVTILSNDGAIVYSDAVLVAIEATVSLPSLMIQGQNLFIDDYNPAVIRPAPSNMLVRFIVTDPALPALMNLKISLRYRSNATGTYYILALKEIKNVTKTNFSEYIELSAPITYASDVTNTSSTYSFRIEGWDAATNTQVMNIADNTYGLLFFDVGGAKSFISDNVISVAIPSLATGTIRNGKVLFQRKL